MKRVKSEIKYKIKLYEIFFFASYALYILTTLCSEFGVANSIIKVINIACLAGLFLAIFESLDKRNAKNIILLLLLLVMSSYLILAISGSNAIIYLFILSFSAKGIKKDKIIRVDLYFKILLVLSVIIGSKIGIIQSGEFMREGEIRNSLGFHHPNFAGLILLNIYLDIIFLRKNKRKTNCLLAIPFFVMIGLIIDSRNAAYGTALAAIIQLIPIDKILNTKTKRVAFPVILIGVFTAISLYFAISPMADISKKLDEHLSGRITYARAFYEYYGINLFGNRFEKYGSNQNGAAFFVLDNGYLYLLIHNGVILYSAVMILYVARIKNSIDEENIVMCSALLAFMCIGLMEQAMFQPIKNPFIIMSGNKKNRRQYENLTNS